MRTLRKLLRDLPYAEPIGLGDTRVAGLAYDSRLVKPGELFVALPGFHSDGALHIPHALARGAVAVITQRHGAVPGGVPGAYVPDARRALTDLAAAYHRFPAREVRVVGVTGTDGKTTTTHLVSAVLEAMGYRTGYITTASIKVGHRVEYNDTQHTTPEPVEIQALLREMADQRLDYAVLESSSHALALERLLHCEFDAAIFTNVSPEHLNFHGSMENYVRDKSRLFAMLEQAAGKGVEKAAILNADDPHSAQMRAATRARAVWYGLGDAGPGTGGHVPLITATGLKLIPTGAVFRLVTPAGSVRVESRLAGRFNVYNWLAAAALGFSQGATLEQLERAIASVDSVPGRMQRIDRGQPFTVIVDFAHTPQALETVLHALRSSTEGRLTVLFGLAGERDPDRRPEMGSVAARFADFAIFTTDDPRFEDPMEIAQQIAAGAEAHGWRQGEHYLKIADREEAIREAFRRARPGDTVLLAGKGHEQRQVVGDRLVPWNDAEAAQRVLRESGY